MAELLNRAEFARLIGVHKSAITHAVRAGRIPSVEGKIDPDDPKIQDFIEARRLSARAAGKTGVGRPVEGGAFIEDNATRSVVRKISAAEDSELAGLDVASKGRILQNRLTSEKLKAKRLENLNEVGARPPKVLVRRGFSTLVAVLEQHFRSLDSSAAIEIDAMVETYRPGKSKADISAYLRQEIDAGIKSFMAASKRAIRDMKKDEDE